MTSKEAATAVIDQWLQDVAARWAEGVQDLQGGDRENGFGKLHDIPPSPGHVSFGDLIEEVRSRVAVVRQ